MKLWPTAATMQEQQTATSAAAAEQQFMTDIWASSDDGSAALNALQGVTGAVTTEGVDCPAILMEVGRGTWPGMN